MTMNRRQALMLLNSLVSLASLASLSPLVAAAPRRKGPQGLALLVPLSGPSGALGRSITRAATLLRAKDEGDLPVFDTAGADGAAGAAMRALKQGARLILGPVFTQEVRPVMAAVGSRALVISFSNDSELRDSGAFLLGVSPSQATSAILGYAADRGIRTVALASGESAWSRAVAAEASRLQSILGLSVQPFAPGEDLAGLDELLRQATPPHAVLIPDGGPGALALARRLQGSNIQGLATLQALDNRPDALAAHSGIWLSAPDPDAFDRFARAFAEHGDSPGLIAALAHDGAQIARQLAAGGAFDSSALLAVPRFAGATGALRFRSDGSCVREMAILVAGPGGYAVVDRRAAA